MARAALERRGRGRARLAMNSASIDLRAQSESPRGGQPSEDPAQAVLAEEIENTRTTTRVVMLEVAISTSTVCNPLSSRAPSLRQWLRATGSGSKVMAPNWDRSSPAAFGYREHGEEVVGLRTISSPGRARLWRHVGGGAGIRVWAGA